MPRMIGASSTNLPKHNTAQRTKKDTETQRTRKEAELMKQQRKPPMRAMGNLTVEKQGTSGSGSNAYDQMEQLEQERNEQKKKMLQKINLQHRLSIHTQKILIILERLYSA